jgi:hypothetical protein
MSVIAASDAEQQDQDDYEEQHRELLFGVKNTARPSEIAGRSLLVFGRKQSTVTASATADRPPVGNGVYHTTVRCFRKAQRCKNTPMPEPMITVKMTKAALRLLRLIAADTDERQYEVLDRLLTEEAKRLSLGSEHNRKSGSQNVK